VGERPEERHYPRPASIEAYGNGGFRFAGMSHRGSILVLPSGVWAWLPSRVDEVDELSLARVIEERDAIDFFLIGAGRDPAPLSRPLQDRLRLLGIHFDVMPTAAAASTYNVLLAEGRRVAAALIAVD
jgi:uncharacterized protein